jgi:diguanylate cyclase (GGDEF)-like protein
MDPNTVITLLALNLIGTGGLLNLIARRMADLPGLRGFGTGALVFGTAYLLRLGVGFDSGEALGLVSDTGMVLATLFFGSGLQRFSNVTPMTRATLGVLLLAYAVLAGAATALWQGVGRHAALNLALALGYTSLAAVAAQGARREMAALRVPLLVLSGLVGLLGLCTGARGVAVMWTGIGPLFAGPWAQAYYTYAIVVTTLLGPNLLWMVFIRLSQRLTDLATRDPLTRLLNRNGLDEVLQRHFSARPPAALALLLLDIDHFKRINDVHGHPIGDAVLRGLAQVLSTQVRGGDVVARWGGEEFLVCCPGADRAWAPALAERLRQAVAMHEHPLPGGQTLRCTVSVGVSAAFSDLPQWHAAVRAADDALYQAKRDGRDRVVVAPGLLPA